MTDEKIIELIIRRPKCSPKTVKFKVIKSNGVVCVENGKELNGATLRRIIKQYEKAQYAQ